MNLKIHPTILFVFWLYLVRNYLKRPRAKKVASENQFPNLSASVGKQIFIIRKF